jgi:hypothetical protein
MAGAGFSDITSLATPAGTITFVSPLAATSGLIIDPKQSTGLGSGEVRSAVDNRAGEDGFILHPEWYEAGATFVLAGIIRAVDAAERNSFQSDTKAKLRSILSATGTLNFSGAPSATVRWYLAVDFPAIDTYLKGFRFGLISADPW